MSTITALVATLSADTSGFTTGMNRSAQTLRAWDKNAGQVFGATRTPLENYQNAVKHLNLYLMTGRINQETYARAVKAAAKDYQDASRSAGTLGQSLAGAGVSLAAFSNPITAAIAVVGTAVAALTAVGTAAVGAGVAGIKLAADYEQTEVAFTTMLGSAQTAKAVLEDLSQFAAETPFEFPELSGAARKLAAFGVSADQLVPSLRTIGDVAAGIGQPIGEIAEIYGKARTQGRLFGDDIRQLGGRGIPIVAELAKQFGVAESKIPKLVEQGKVGFDNLQRALVSLTAEGGRFYNMMENQSQTLTGLYSTLKDNVNLSLRDIGQAIIKELDLKAAAQELIEFTGVFREQWVPEIAEGIGALKDFAVATYELDEALGGPISQLKALATFVGAARTEILELQLAYAKLTGNDTLASVVENTLAERAKPREKKTKKPDALKVEDRGPDTTAQEKAVKDWQSFTEQLDEQFNSLGLSSQQAKLQEFFKLAQTGKVKLDTADLDQARQKLATLERAQATQKARELTAELEKQVATFGMDANAVKVYELAQQGANQADLQAIAVLNAKLSALKRQKDIGDFIADLQKRIALVGQGGDAAKFYDLQAKGATAAELAMARLWSNSLKQKEALQQVVDEFTKVRDSAKLFTTELAAPFQKLFAELQELSEQLKQGKITQEQFDRAKERGMSLAKEAVSVFDETRTPFEKFQAEMNRLKELYARGFIDEDTFDRATRKKIGELDKDRTTSPAALEKGSAEAYSAILKASQGDSQEKWLAKQYAAQEKQIAEQQRTNQLLRQRGPQVEIRDMPR